METQKVMIANTTVEGIAKKKLRFWFPPRYALRRHLTSTLEIMQSHTEYAGQVLDEARAAFAENDFESSLAKYEWFFDHALDEDKASYYGVRLSYCLNEWSKLGEKYPNAADRFAAKCVERKRLFEETKDPEYFHDYVVISGYLNQTALALDTFMTWHESDPNLASRVVSFVWEPLLQSGAWSVCGAYVENADEFYERAIHSYCETMGICLESPEFGGEEFANEIRDWYVADVSNLLAVLTNTSRTQEAGRICERANLDIRANTIAVPEFVCGTR
jgi:hypothetical protein